MYLSVDNNKYEKYKSVELGDQLVHVLHGANKDHNHNIECIIFYGSDRNLSRFQKLATQGEPKESTGNRIYPWKGELDKKRGANLDSDINSQSQCNQGLEWGGQNASGWRGKLDKTICKSFFVLPYSQHIYQGIITSPPIFYTHIYTNN